MNFNFLTEAFGDDEDMKSIFLESLKNELSRYVNEMNNAISNSSSQAFHETIHKLRPQLQQLEVTDFLNFIEDNKELMTKENDKKEFSTKFNSKVDSLLNEINEELKTFSTED